MAQEMIPRSFIKEVYKQKQITHGRVCTCIWKYEMELIKEVLLN